MVHAISFAVPSILYFTDDDVLHFPSAATQTFYTRSCCFKKVQLIETPEQSEGSLADAFVAQKERERHTRFVPLLSIFRLM